jgi:hypothetical protein
MGTLDDFTQFADATHDNGMLLVVDIVLAVAAVDSAVAEAHPEWFYQENGVLLNRVTHRSDEADFDYTHTDMWDCQLDIIKFWNDKADGFRFTAASLIPVEFWRKARAAAPDAIFLADTLEPTIITQYRNEGYYAASDGELFEVFDICYDSDILRYFDAYLNKYIPLTVYTSLLELQEAIYPSRYCKLRFLETPYRRRIKSFTRDSSALRSWTAFCYMQKGAVMINAGQEHSATVTPALTEEEPVAFHSGHDLTSLLRRLYKLKKDPLLSQGSFYITPDEKNDLVTYRYIQNERWLEGSFSLQGKNAIANTHVPDGEYLNLLDYSTVKVTHGKYGVDSNSALFCSDLKVV